LSFTPTGANGYIRQFDQQRPLITQHLKAMYANGQRRLGFPILYYEGGDTIALDSSSGEIAGQDKQNLNDLLSLAADIGFLECVCEMVPEWSAAWNDWANPTVMQQLGTRYWQPEEYARNLLFTDSVWSIFQKGRMLAHLDPLAEAIPAPGQQLLLDYCQRYIYDLRQQFGDPGLGFSIIPTLDRVPMIRQVYSTEELPAFWNIHLYPSAIESWPQFKAAMNAAGLGGRGYIWGETYCANQQCVVDAVNADRSDLFFVLGWPVGPDTPQGVSQDRLTLEYSLYAAAGI